MPTAIRTGLDARIVANQFLDLGRAENIVIDPMKIQKLVYLAHGWNLAFFDAPLISQSVEAWKYGPVIRDLYGEFREFGALPITRNAPYCTVGYVDPRQSSDHIQNVWSVYKGYDAVQLSMLTHEPGAAWDRTIKARQPVIPESWIAEEFVRRRTQL